VEPCEPGKGMKNGGLFSTLNLLKVLEVTLNNGTAPASGVQLQPNRGNKSLRTFTSPEEILSALRYQIECYVRLIVTGINGVAKAFAELTPCPYASALMDDCIARGKGQLKKLAALLRTYFALGGCKFNATWYQLKRCGMPRSIPRNIPAC